jgi:uncharacterized protein DUF5675
MELLLERVEKKPGFTIGSLSVDGDWQCWTIEDETRDGPKVPGKTAIPAGKYWVQVTMSARFKKPLPLLLNVPNFEGVRIHPGNTAEDTEGCILPGADRYASSVGRSRVAFDALFVKIKDAIARGERVSIEIV